MHSQRAEQLFMFGPRPDDRALEHTPAMYRDLIEHDTKLTLPAWASPIDSRFALAFGVRIDGDPHGKGSVRVKITPPPRHQWWKKSKARGTQAPKSKTYESLLAKLAGAQPMRGGYTRPLDGPLIVRVLAVKKRIKTLPREAIPYIEGRPEGRRFCPVTPDWDNIGKSVGDGLKKGGTLADDARIVDGRVTTLYAAVDEDPFVEAFVWALRR